MSSTGSAARLQVHVDREREAEHGIDLARGQHRLAHGEADVLEFHGAVVELVDGLEDRPLGVGAVGGRRAELLAHQALGIGGDALALAADDGERRPVVDHHDGLEVDRRVLVAEADQRVHVAGADVVGAGGDAGDRLARAVARVDGDVEPLGFEVALVERHRERRGRALEAPVEGEFHRRLRPGAVAPCRPGWRAHRPSAATSAR